MKEKIFLFLDMKRVCLPTTENRVTTDYLLVLQLFGHVFNIYV